MSNFWSSEIGEITGKSEDAFAKSFKLIPDGTMALAKINFFKNDEYNGNRYFSIEWILMDGEFKGNKVTQKIKAFDNDLKIKHRALNMMKLIYDLFKIKPTSSSSPTDEELSSFLNKIAGIRVRETEPNDEGKQYNWVSEVHVPEGFKCETGIKIVVTHKNIASNSPIESAFSRNRQNHVKGSAITEDDIPW